MGCEVILEVVEEVFELLEVSEKGDPGTPVDHNDLISIQGGTVTERYHLTAAEVTKLGGIEDGAEVNNISDPDATDLTDGGETTLHVHAVEDHNDLISIQGGTVTERYHLTVAELGRVISAAQKAALDGANSPSAANVLETRNESESAKDATGGGTVTLDVTADNVFVVTTDDTAFTFATTGEADSRGITLVLKFTAAIPAITWPALANNDPDLSGATPVTGKAVVEMAYLDGAWWAWLVEAI